MGVAWESELAKFLSDLSSVQSETLRVLGRKRELLAAADAAGLAELAEEEEELIGRLEGCLKHRQQLLTRAEGEGLPSDSIRSLTAALPGKGPDRLADRFHAAAGQTRLLRHHSLTNWVLVQRTLIHLSQMLEIIATGGRQEPTYSRDGKAREGGALVDHVA